MLIRCVGCGRPVYRKINARTASCPYCYQLNTSPFAALDAQDLNWRQPFLCQAEEEEDFSKAIAILTRLGDGFGIGEVRARLTAQHEKYIADLFTEVESVLLKAEYRSQLIPLFSIMEKLPEGEKKHTLSQALEKRAAEMQIREDREEVEKLYSMLRQPSSMPPEKFRDAIKDADKIAVRMIKVIYMPEAKELQRKALDVEAALEKRLSQVIKEIERRERRKKYIKVFAAVAVFLLIIGFCVYSADYRQPAILREARQCWTAGDYAQAEKLYLSLTNRTVNVNYGVQNDAEEELWQMRNEWAGLLYDQKDYTAAIDVYWRSGRREKASQIQAEFGDILAEQGKYKEAINQWNQAYYNEDREKRIRMLYALWAKQQYDGGDFYEAYETAKEAGDEELGQAGITRFLIMTELSRQLVQEKKLDSALFYCRRAAELADTQTKKEITSQLATEIAEGEGQQAIDAWRAAGSDSSNLDILRNVGERLRNPDHQLYYWKQLDQAGIDLEAVYPEGVEVDWSLLPPEPEDEERKQGIDDSRPLVLCRREDDYQISPLDINLQSNFHDHDPTDLSVYSFMLMPEWWQRLEPERRPESLSECSCIILADLTYVPDGTLHGFYRYYLKQSWKVGRRTYSNPQVIANAMFFPKYLARMRVLYWNWRQNTARKLFERNIYPRYSQSFTLDTVVSWDDATVTRSKKFTDLGLSGEFDLAWVRETMKLYFSEWHAGDAENQTDPSALAY